MIQISSILVPTDFSQYGEQALRYGCALADKFGSHVHLLHVVDDYYPYLPEGGAFIDRRDDYLGGLRTGAERLCLTRNCYNFSANVLGCHLCRLFDAGWTSGSVAISGLSFATESLCRHGVRGRRRWLCHDGVS